MKLTSLIVLLCLFCQSALADSSPLPSPSPISGTGASCDFSRGIKPNTDGTYTYSKACHLKVGSLVKENQDQIKATDDLNKAIQLKDLALQKSDQRATMWEDTSSKMEDRLSKIDSLEKSNTVIYFALGALTVLGAGFMASSFNRH